MLQNAEGSTRNKERYTQVQRKLAEEIAAYFLKYPDRKVVIREIAEYLQISETRLKDSFRAYYGASPYFYCKRQKMEEAARLLRETQIPVKQIAGSLGYENGSKFASAFRSIYGTTPRRYRVLKKK